jgi:hypothetical protein
MRATPNFRGNPDVARSTDARHSCFGAIIVRACMSADFLWILLSLS